jgi:hypothetical protein
MWAAAVAAQQTLSSSFYAAAAKADNAKALCCVLPLGFDEHFRLQFLPHIIL